MVSCDIPKCAKKVLGRGWCAMHYSHWQHFGDPLKGSFFAGHGKSGTPEHRSWKAMHTRCYNKNNPAYKSYGGRGIKVCDRWRGVMGFSNFYSDMGKRPSLNHSIDRINNDGGYEPDNCRWATKSEQMINRTMPSKSGIKGISWYNKYQNWRLAIKVDGNWKFAGYYNTLEEARAAQQGYL